MIRAGAERPRRREGVIGAFRVKDPAVEGAVPIKEGEEVALVVRPAVLVREEIDAQAVVPQGADGVAHRPAGLHADDEAAHDQNPSRFRSAFKVRPSTVVLALT